MYVDDLSGDYLSAHDLFVHDLSEDDLSDVCSSVTTWPGFDKMVCSSHYFTRRTDQIDHLQIYHLQIDKIDQIIPHLPFRDVMQDIYSTNPTQETCPTLGQPEYTAPTRPHELDRTNHTDQ